MGGVILSIVLLALLSSCHRPQDKHLQLSLTAYEESIVEDIHKILYENPLSSRQEAIQILDTLSEAKVLMKISLLKALGSSYVLEANYSEGLKYYNDALLRAKDVENYFEIANINNNIGVVYREIGDIKSAYLHFVEALDFYDLAHNYGKKIGALNNIGLVYLHLNNCEKAMGYFNEALEYKGEALDSILIVSVLNNAALCKLSQEKAKEALEHLDEALQLSQKINNTYGLCISYQIKGKVYSELNDPDKALEAYALSSEIARSTSFEFQLAISEMGIAEVLLNSGRIEESLVVTQNVMKMADEQDNLSLKNGAHFLFSQIYERRGDFEKSLFHHKEYINAQQEIVNQTTIHQVYDIELNYLNNLNKMQELEIEKKELVISKKNYLLGFSFLIFVLLLVGLYLIYVNLRHKQEVKFQKTIIELNKKKAHAALVAEIQERKRIGQELHDSLGHLLSLAGIHASVLHKRNHDFEENKRKELLETLMKTIDDAFIEVRTISHNLAPSLLSERGLQGALKSISDRVNQSPNLRMTYKTFGLNGKLDKLIENTLFRTIQEIVNNTIKHSKASDLYVQIVKGNNEITLMAEDNGSGFDVNEISDRGNGLSNMKSRIENLKGNLFIDSNPQRGTIISILIPLE